MMGFTPGGSSSNSIAGGSDVALNSVSDTQVLSYESGSSKWINRTIAGSDAQVYQMPGPSGGDDTGAINAALTGLTAGKTRVVLFRSGTYRTTGILITNPYSVVFRGVGTSHVGGAVGTQLTRSNTGSGPVIDVRGNPGTLSNAALLDPANRVRFDIHNMEVSGNNTGIALRTFRASDCIFENIRFERAGVAGLVLTQMHNSRIEGCFVGYSGLGTSNPAMVITGTSEGPDAGSNGLHITDCELENNKGTDIMISAGSTSSPTEGIMMSQMKTERGSGEFPQLVINTGAELQITNTYMYLGTSSTATQIVVNGGRFISSCMNIKRGGTSSAYAIRQSGANSLVNVAGSYFESFPSTKSILVDANVGPNRTRLAGISMIPSEEQGNKLIQDNRTNKGSYKYPV